MSDLLHLSTQGNKGNTIADIMPDVIAQCGEDDELLDGQVIKVTESPVEELWCLIPLYGFDQKKKERVWQIGFDGADIVTIHGQVGGKLQKSTREIITKGGKTPQEQALVMARNKWLEKYTKHNYRPKGYQVEERCAYQLANKYTPPWIPRKYHTSNIKFPVALQPKLDGDRVSAWLERDLTGVEQVSLYTRGNKKITYFQPHREELKLLFKYLPPGVGLDGEWYNHKLTHNIISGIARRSKNCKGADVDLQMYIYDIILPGSPLEDRIKMIVRAYYAFLKDGHHNKYFQILNTTWANSHEEIADFHNQYVEMGYEGAMIRKLSFVYSNSVEETYYKGNRNANLLKVKAFEEEEVTVIDVYEAKGGNGRGAAVFRVRDKDGLEYGLTPSNVNMETRREWAKHPELCIGRIYTIEYIEKNPNGIPKAITAKGFRDTLERKGEIVY